MVVPPKNFCHWHGGMSTGPRTPEGKARVTRNLPGHGER
ncbi:MAG: HGGxSTG domain-containing protein [Terriglobia bacterium]